MSLTCHEEIGRVRHVARGCYENSREEVRNKLCVSGSWKPENDTTHGQTGAALHHSRPPADQSRKSVASWTGKSPDTRDIPTVASSRGCRARVAAGVSAEMSRGCNEETAPVEFQHIAIDRSWLAPRPNHRPRQWPRQNTEQKTAFMHGLHGASKGPDRN